MGTFIMVLMILGSGCFFAAAVEAKKIVNWFYAGVFLYSVAFILSGGF